MDYLLHAFGKMNSKLLDSNIILFINNFNLINLSN